MGAEADAFWRGWRAAAQVVAERCCGSDAERQAILEVLREERMRMQREEAR